MRRLVLVVSVLVLCSGTVSAEKLTYAELVERLVDMEHLATLPPEGLKAAQWSSYDHRSRYDAEQGRYVYWDGNWDGDEYIRKEGDNLVLAEMEGPGCIWRIWSAQTEAGRVKIYIDGREEPAVNLPFKAYFDGTNEPFVYPSLVYTAARGKNCYVPIPYQESCKVVAEKGWGRYYHFTYQTFPEGTPVPSFSRSLSAGARTALERVDDFLSNRLGSDPAGRRPGQKSLEKNLTISPGETTTVARLSGPRAITAFKVMMDFRGREDEIKALRQLAIRITWDGSDRPAVWAPLGDFFGTAHGVNHYSSLPLGMTEDGFYCYWYMPFAESAHVQIANDGGRERQMSVSLTHAPLQKPLDRYGRFHCKWHRDAYLPDEPGRDIDWTMLLTRGRGRFCGVTLHVYDGGDRWWGEGDEKFFVDGEKFPSTFGTGTEDYFGYAWGNTSEFARPYHSQSLCTGWQGHIALNRWHIPDNVPFQESFEGTIEKYFPNSRPTLYACTACWYLAPGGDDPYRPQPVDRRVGYCPEMTPYEEEGALEGEDMKVLEYTGGSIQRQDLSTFGTGWSNQSQLLWKAGRLFYKLVLAVPVEKTGTYRLRAQFTKAPDYGIVQLYLDDKPLGDTIDLYSPKVEPSGHVDLGSHHLQEGLHRLKVRTYGANPRAEEQFYFGLDWLKLSALKSE